MSKRQNGGFLFGLLAGLAFGGLLGLVRLLLPQHGADPQGLSLAALTFENGMDWAYRNLGLSLPVFAVVLALYAYSVYDLRRRVANGCPADEVAQSDHLTDTWTSLFFGVGVIWTAIGMRGALLHALGDPATTATDGAFALLQRLVNGGILVALSTTIFGGIGGYVMRVVKTVLVGAPLKRYYDQAAQEQNQTIQSTLDSMERHLASLAGGESRSGDGNDVRAAQELA